MLLLNEIPGGLGVPRTQFACVDVRDVAEAHLQAVLRDDIKNRRFIMVSENYWFTELGEILHSHYGDNGYPNACRT